MTELNRLFEQFLRERVNPSTAASYTLSARTSTEWRTPRESLIETHLRTAGISPGILALSSNIRQPDAHFV
jgi:hypothetical protein